MRVCILPFEHTNSIKLFITANNGAIENISFSRNIFQATAQVQYILDNIFCYFTGSFNLLQFASLSES